MNTEIKISTIHLALSFTEISASARWGVKFATSHPDCLGKTMSQVACELGYFSKATISKYAVMFCEQAGLPPSEYMRSETTRQSSRKARNKFIEKA